MSIEDLGLFADEEVLAWQADLKKRPQGVSEAARQKAGLGIASSCVPSAEGQQEFRLRQGDRKDHLLITVLEACLRDPVGADIAANPEVRQAIEGVRPLET